MLFSSKFFFNYQALVIVFITHSPLKGGSEWWIISFLTFVWWIDDESLFIKLQLSININDIRDSSLWWLDDEKKVYYSSFGVIIESSFIIAKWWLLLYLYTVVFSPFSRPISSRIWCAIANFSAEYQMSKTLFNWSTDRRFDDFFHLICQFTHLAQKFFRIW